MQSDDYKKGWFDGYQAGKAGSWPLGGGGGQPPISTKSVLCGTCGITWTGAMGYVCPYPDCPTQPKVR